MTNAQSIIIKTEDEMLTQMKILLNNGYVVGVHKIDNLLGNVCYKLMYTKGAD